MKKLIISVYSILGVLLVLGTFVDYSLTESLYNPNSPFGLFMARFIYIPTFLMGYISLFIIVRPLLLSKIPYKVGTLSLFFLVYLALTAIFLGLFTYYDLWVVLLIVLLMNSIGITLTWFIPKDRLYKFQKIALLYLVVLTTSYALVYLLKLLWSRERFFLLESAEDFSLWFIPQKMNLGARYTSFPSGHVTAAAMTMIFVFIPLMIESLKKYFMPISMSVGLYVMLGALSRMMLGKHYLTDTVFATLIVLSVFLYFYKIIHPKENEIV